MEGSFTMMLMKLKSKFAVVTMMQYMWGSLRFLMI